MIRNRYSTDKNVTLFTANTAKRYYTVNYSLTSLCAKNQKKNLYDVPEFKCTFLQPK